MDLFFVKNTINSEDANIVGYSLNFDGALGVLNDFRKSCVPEGKLEVFKTDLDALNPQPVCVYSDVASTLSQNDKQYLNFFMGNAFYNLPFDVKVGSNLTPEGFYDFICRSSNLKQFKDFLVVHDITPQNQEFRDCFSSVCEKHLIANMERGKSSETKGLDSMIAAAKAISDQSAQLSSNLQKHKDNLELE